LAQFEFLEKGCLGFKSYYAFRAQYAELQEITIQRKGNLQSFKHVTGYKNLDKLRATINELAYIVKKEDCLDLPERLPPMYYNVELTKEQAVLYESLKKRSIVELEKDGSIVSVKQAITKLLRLHQLVCGHLKDDDGVFHEIETNKIKVLGEILDETRGIVIIWTHYTYDILNIKKFLEKEYGPKSVLTYYGDTSQEERAYVKEIFKRGRENNETRFLVANDKTGGYGNNWTAATTSIYYSYDYDYNIHHQTQDRIYRIGQTERTTNVYLVTKGTVEEKMIEVLRTRKNIADMLIQSNWKDLF
jgi:SNF2 family DNA or RNA helicase